MSQNADQQSSSNSLSQEIAAYNEQRISISDVRSQGLKRLMKIFLPLLALLVALVVLAWNWIGPGTSVIGLIVGVVALIFAYFWMRNDVTAPAEILQLQLREKILPKIFHDFEDFNFESEVHGFLDQIPVEILPEYDKGEWGDLIEGKIDGRKFAINEMELIEEVRTRGNSTSNETRFKGVAIRAKLKTKVPSKLIVRNNRMAATKWITGKLGITPKENHIEFDDKEFEKRHDIHCKDEDYARRVFSKSGIDNYHAMQERYSTGKFQFVASKNTLTMMIEQNHDFFEIPHIDKPFDETTDVARLRDEINGFLELLREMEALIDQ